MMATPGLLWAADPVWALPPNAEEALTWAWLKMAQEKAAQDLAQKHPAVADALDAVRLAEQQLQTVVALCTV
jgi:hypothetical protein